MDVDLLLRTKERMERLRKNMAENEEKFKQVKYLSYKTVFMELNILKGTILWLKTFVKLGFKSGFLHARTDESHICIHVVKC